MKKQRKDEYSPLMIQRRALARISTIKGRVSKEIQGARGCDAGKSWEGRRSLEDRSLVKESSKKKGGEI